ncbi:MAG: methylmalonyl-CoA mutase [Magnetococcales bacterium]|nr:methylmalonyl-CoA mutase [Magnetococcales bacterium]
MNDSDRSQKLLDQWHKAAERGLRGKPLASLERETPEGIRLTPLYTETDLDGIDHMGVPPGITPYVRGPYPTMYAGRPWTIRQYAGFSTAEASNAFYKQALAAGGQGISVAFDLPTHRGYDSDHPRASGDVGMAGVAVDSVEDMKILFDGINLGNTSVSMTMNGAVLPILGGFVAAAEEQGVPQSELRGTIQNDILKEFMVRNTYIYPPAPSMRVVGDIIRHCSGEMPRFNTISISGYHLQEAGADAALELAYTIANGKAYVETALAGGLDVDAFAPRLSFFFGIGMNFMMEVAKLRAARLLWAEVMGTFSPKDPRSSLLRTHCQTSGWSLTSQLPYNNIVRTTIEAMAAVFGGTQSLHTNALDEAMALPSEFSAQIARHTQVILQEETDIPAIADPWAGSYAMESLTDQLAQQARKIMAEVDQAGGMVKAIETGLPMRRIETAAARKQARIDRGTDRIVGVNRFRPEEEEPPEVLRVDNSMVRENQQRRLAEIRASRDEAAVQGALKELTQAAKEARGNLLDLTIRAMRLRATVGETTAALEEVYGRHQEQARALGGVYGEMWKDDADWAALKETINDFARREGRRPRILLAKLGQDGHDRGVKVVAAAFADMGFDVDLGPLFQTPDEAAAQAVESDVHVVGASTLAGGHRTLAPELVQALKARGAEDIVVVVGGVVPKQDIPELLEKGVAAVFGPGTPAMESGRRVMELLGANRSG